MENEIRLGLNTFQERINIEINVPVQDKEEELSAIQSLEASPDCVKDLLKYAKAKQDDRLENALNAEIAYMNN